MKLRVSSEARSELLHIGGYIAEKNPAGALHVVRDLRAKCMQLKLMPLAYPLGARFERLGPRRCVVGNYLIFYRVEADVVFVTNIIHGARDYEALHDQLR